MDRSSRGAEYPDVLLRQVTGQETGLGVQEAFHHVRRRRERRSHTQEGVRAAGQGRGIIAPRHVTFRIV